MLTQQILSGFLASGVYALFAVGFTMIFGVMGVLNMAHADFATVAALTIIMVVGAGLGPVPAIVITLLVTGAVAVLVERVAMRPARRFKGDAAIEMPLIATIGAGMIIQNGAALMFGNKALVFPWRAQSFIKVGGYFVSQGLVYSMVVACALLVALEVLVHRTDFGRQIRAVALNPMAARVMGIDVNRVIVITVFITSMLAATAGCLAGISYGLVSPLMGIPYAIKGLVAMIVGGVGSLRGAVLGAMLIGVSEAVAVTYLGSQARDVSVFVVLILVLSMRPGGLVPTAQMR